MTKTDIAKTAVSFVVGSGTSKIVTGIIRSNVSADKLTDQVAIASAGVVIGMMAADATKNYTDTKIDEIVDWWKRNVKKTA